MGIIFSVYITKYIGQKQCKYLLKSVFMVFIATIYFTFFISLKQKIKTKNYANL